MFKILSQILNLIYIQKKCIGCNCDIVSGYLCKNCLENFSEKIKNEMYIRKIDGFLVYSALKYENTIKNFIHQYKFNKQQNFADFFAFILKEMSNILNLNYNYTVISVPTFIFRNLKRNFDHTELICEKFCQLTGYKYNNKILRRIKYTPPLFRLKKEKRIEVLKNCFFAKSDTKLKNKPIILIDDIITTGSTIKECLLTLKKAGYNNITVFTLTHLN